MRFYNRMCTIPGPILKASSIIVIVLFLSRYTWDRASCGKVLPDADHPRLYARCPLGSKLRDEIDHDTHAVIGSSSGIYVVLVCSASPSSNNLNLSGPGSRH